MSKMAAAAARTSQRCCGFASRRRRRRRRLQRRRPATVIAAAAFTTTAVGRLRAPRDGYVWGRRRRSAQRKHGDGMGTSWAAHHLCAPGGPTVRQSRVLKRAVSCNSLAHAACGCHKRTRARGPMVAGRDARSELVQVGQRHLRSTRRSAPPRRSSTAGLAPRPDFSRWSSRKRLSRSVMSRTAATWS